MHKVVILALPNVVPLDLVIPLEIFSRARSIKGTLCYDVKICSQLKTVKNPYVSFKINHSLPILSRADTIVIPGTELTKPIPKLIREQLIKAHKKGTRIISICSGAFLLAETGLLNGLNATTHWLGTEELQKKFPEVNVNPNVLYTDEGNIMTSAGACAGIDLCLHVIRKDFGAAVAAHSARIAVMPLERSGGQAQHINHDSSPNEPGSLSKVLDWIEANLERNLSLEKVAKKAGMSVRTLNRQFIKQTGTSPLKWILKARIRRARTLLETTQYSMTDIAEAVGFNSAITMREHFRTLVHTNPKSYRESFQQKI